MRTRPAAHVIRFDCFEVDLSTGQLLKRGVRLRLREQSFQAPAALLEHAGQVVKREHLRRLLWHDNVFVDFDNNLNAVVANLRKVLNDSAGHPRFAEPTGSLGSVPGAHVIDLLFRMNREHGTTLVLVTHDEALAARCDRRIAISAGDLIGAAHQKCSRWHVDQGHIILWRSAHGAG